MSPSQRQVVITLIEKQDKNRTNVDAKIASEVIATRIVKVLPEVIHSDQTWYVWGRHMGEAAIFSSGYNELHENLWYCWIANFYRFWESFRQSGVEVYVQMLEFFGSGSSVTKWIETFLQNNEWWIQTLS